MALHKLKYSVTQRWLGEDYETIDQYGNIIRTPNPNPNVKVYQGVWSQKDGEHVKFEISAKEFREMTGIVVYGGNIEKRGMIVTIVSDTVHSRIQARWLNREESSSKRSKGKRRDSQDYNKIHEERLERASRGDHWKSSSKPSQVRIRKKK